VSIAFDQIDSSIPQVHALLIGVGGYRHLVGGSDVREQIFDQVGVIDQLTSPPRSALAFAEWFMGTTHTLAQPLGSVDLLVSASPSDTAFSTNGVPTREPTIANIRDAYADWKARCDSHEDNIAIFYYCGHGLEKDDQYLFAEDFGAVKLTPWIGSFAFDETRLGFHTCKAKTQCFFIDACRNITHSMLNTNPTRIPLDMPFFNGVECQHGLTIKATAGGEKALGPREQPSYFLQALLKALDGAAAHETGGGWEVNTGQLAAQITDILGLVNPAEGFSQRCPARVTASTKLLTVTSLPTVQLELSCVPDTANPFASLACWPVHNIQNKQQQAGGPWTVEVEAGIYHASATFPGGEFQDQSDLTMVGPPVKQVPLKVEVYS